MDSKVWWKKPLRIIQYNLQIMDTPKMQPEKIAEELMEMGANAAVLNVGGIYAWYPSEIPYHHINEYLPKEYDLLQALLDACHKRGIKVIARFDFSKTDDVVYLQKPQWFVKREKHRPVIYGKDRMGPWSLLVTTCVNGGYRNEEFAVPVIEEVLGKYDIDGIFLNAPHVEECYCEMCQRKYKAYYQKELPDRAEEFEADWKSRCLQDNIGNLYHRAKEIRAEVPVILYYSTYHKPGKGEVDRLDDRYQTADLICTEAQDILSAGVDHLHPSWKPGVNMKLGSLDDHPRPLGIIHSSPGMDWRHTGLPRAEYAFWMSQIVANRGQLWHSLTGFNDTITDKRVIDAVTKVNHMVKSCEAHMEEARSAAQVLLLWDGGHSAVGWVEGLVQSQIPFELMDIWHLDERKIKEYPVVILPDGFPLDDSKTHLINQYVLDGGNLIVEKTESMNLDLLSDLLGIEPMAFTSPDLQAAYIRMEAKDPSFSKNLQDTELIPLSGKVLYTCPKQSVEVHMTLVPPFAPLDGVGAPPERASLPVSRTEIPMGMRQFYGKGKVLFLPFALSQLITGYRLADHYDLLQNCVDSSLGDQKLFEMERIYGMQVGIYKNRDQLLVHMINGVGQRPLVTSTPWTNLRFSIRRPQNRKIEKITGVISGQDVSYHMEGPWVHCILKKLDVWDMICIQYSKE